MTNLTSPNTASPHTASPTTACDPLYLAFQTALAGRYSIDRELGRGGMGVVYLAREVHLDRLVAIKLLPPELAARPARRERFLREAQLAAKLSHPHIIPIHSVNETDGFVYFVMAYVDCETLAQRVHARGPVSASDGIRMLREVAWALGHAHGQGLVHRDVKPDNILLEAHSGRALVADFGIAAATGDTFGDGVSGTPEFMSPEQALGREIDARSVLYSLGATAFYALSGRLPFSGTTASELLARHVTEDPPPLASVGTAVPRKLAHLIDRCLAKDPAQRPRTAQELAEQLGVAIEQRRELPVALRAFVRRNGRMDGGGSLLSLSTVAVAGVATGKMAGVVAGIAVLGGGVVLATVTFGVVAARQLLRQGFAQADIVPAFRAERESSREERSAAPGRIRTLLERASRTVAMVTGSTALALLTFAILNNDVYQRLQIGALSGLGLLVALASGLAYLALLQSRRDVDVEFWSTLWTGRAGTWSFAIAKRLRGGAPVARAMTHRATELSLGMAAEQLFESLPKATRASLGDVPTLLQRLQRDAQLLRTRLDALQDALQHAPQDARMDGVTPDSMSRVHDVQCAYAAVRDERAAVQDRLRATVGAMETIRLNLLRLHAGSLSLEAFTTHVDQALDVSADVARMIDAQAEVEALLLSPNAGATGSAGAPERMTGRVVRGANELTPA